jgi:hypothetical protein
MQQQREGLLPLGGRARALCVGRAATATRWGEVDRRYGSDGKGRCNAGDDDEEVAADQGGAVATPMNSASTTIGRGIAFCLSVTTMAVRIDGSAVHPRRALPSAEIDLDLPGGMQEQQKWRRGLGLGSKPRRLIPCKRSRMRIMWSMYCNEPLRRYI